MAVSIKDKLIKKETARLNRIFKHLPDDHKKAAIGLIERSAYLRISLEELERDLDLNGYVELFSQSDKLEPYERERPAARLYANLLSRYAAISKQLNNMLPDMPEAEAPDDCFDSFVSGRDD